MDIMERKTAENHVAIETLNGFDGSVTRRRSINGMPVDAMGPVDAVVFGDNVNYPAKVVPYSG